MISQDLKMIEVRVLVNWKDSNKKNWFNKMRVFSELGVLLGIGGPDI